jgi:uroporphyrinogen-III synthase
MSPKPPVFITRPADQAAPLAEAVRARGYAPVLAPCLVLEIEDGPPLDPTGIAAVAATSANGVKALLARWADRTCPVYAVGEATAAAARAGGFVDVITAGGDAASLARLIAGRAAQGTAILHAAGEDRAFDLAGALSPLGIGVRVEALYAMPVARALPSDALAVLDAGHDAAALLMSARTAAAFGELVSSAGRRLDGVSAICLSQAVADAAAAFPFRCIAVSSRPSVDALLDLLEAREGGE